MSVLDVELLELLGAVLVFMGFLESLSLTIISGFFYDALGITRAPSSASFVASVALAPIWTVCM